MEPPTEVKIIPGDYAWIGLALFVVTYDVTAVSTKKAETMSSAIWRSLSHKYKFPIAGCIWGALTWHLFFNPKARSAYKIKIDKHIKSRKV